MRLPFALFASRPDMRVTKTLKSWGLLVALFAVAVLAPRAESATYYVDGPNAACNNSGPGTQAQPFCTISGGATAGRICCVAQCSLM